MRSTSANHFSTLPRPRDLRLLGLGLFVAPLVPGCCRISPVCTGNAIFSCTASSRGVRIRPRPLGRHDKNGEAKIATTGFAAAVPIAPVCRESGIMCCRLLRRWAVFFIGLGSATFVVRWRGHDRHPLGARFGLAAVRWQSCEAPGNCRHRGQLLGRHYRRPLFCGRRSWLQKYWRQ